MSFDSRHGIELAPLDDNFLDRVRIMPIIYVAGPYSAPTEYLVRKNVEAAREAADDVWAMGGVAICPHTNSGGMGGLLSEPTRFLEGDLNILLMCQAAYFLPTWQSSPGACKEREFCELCLIPIFDDLEELRSFIAEWYTERAGDSTLLMPTEGYEYE